MIFAHGPLGFIIAWVTHNIWKNWVKKGQEGIVLAAGFILGMLPDLDMVYFYFVNATESHREFPSHSWLVWTVVWGVFLGVSFLARWGMGKAMGLVGYLATLSHLLADSLGGGVAWLWPFSDHLYGLASFFASGNEISFFGQYFRQINFAVEALLVVVFILILSWAYLKNRAVKIFLTVILGGGWIFFLGLLIWSGRHLYSSGFSDYLVDIDQDGEVNNKDLDMDGDGVMNIDDPDADGDEIVNQEELVQALNQMEGTWYDPTEGGYGEFLSRLGFVINTDPLVQSYKRVGIHLIREMRDDFEAGNTEGYIGHSEDSEFKDLAENYYNYFAHQGYLVEDQPLIFGDVVFYGDNHDHLALVYEVDKSGRMLKVFEASPGRLVGVVDNEIVVVENGEISGVARVLK